MLAAASCCMPGITWLDRSIVIAIVACPSRSWTTLGWIFVGQQVRGVRVPQICRRMRGSPLAWK
jgi:hypothetical protein